MFRSPLFAWSPRPDHNTDPFDTPASQSSSRFGAFRHNVRSMINGSSIYSQSPALPNNSTPKPPFLGFLRREYSPNPDALPVHNELPRNSDDSRSSLRAHHTAGSYIHTIAPLQDPREPETIYARHPADVPLPRQDSGLVDPESQESTEEFNGRRHRRRHRRRKQRHTDHWVRRRHEPSTQGPMLFIRGSPARRKMFSCILSGSFLLTVLATYLAIALTNRNIGQEIHILFIMILLSITIFFCHSLIRLCMLILNPPREHAQPHIPAMLGPDGFQPIVPIRVHLARDEEARTNAENDLERGSLDLEKDLVAPPPPAYGLWRSSVRVDPNLLHWQRVDGQENRDSVAPRSRQSSASGPTARFEPAVAPEVPRPPSYVSEDGVSYIIEAAPRSTVRQSHSGVSDIHPAWRPGYAISEIRGDEWGSVRR